MVSEDRGIKKCARHHKQEGLDFHDLIKEF
jgi:hypothetical protein